MIPQGTARLSQGVSRLPQGTMRSTGDRYLGQVATRSRICQSVSGANTQINSASAHIARDDITAIQVGFGNWYQPIGSSGELDGGAVDTFTVSLEWPLSTFTQFTWGGATNAASLFTPGALILSDPLSVTIPSGSQFRIRTWRAASGGNIVFCTDTSTVIRSTAMGDVMQYTASGQVDRTLGGTITQTSTGANQYYPTLILGVTRKASVIAMGDSRCFGRGDTVNTGGDLGNTCRALGGFGYCNAGTSQDRLSWLVSSNAKRLALLKFFTHAIVEYGANDIFADQRTAAQVETDLTAVYALLRGRLQAPHKVGQNTIEPWTTTAANTTPETGSSERLLLNTWIRGAGGGADFYSDVGGAMQSATNNGLWGVTAQQTDGIHENQAGYIAASAAINTVALTR